jgi:hypothetical protein
VGAKPKLWEQRRKAEGAIRRRKTNPAEKCDQEIAEEINSLKNEAHRD